jgi:hypothetical protein
MTAIPKKPTWLSRLHVAQVKRVQRQLNEFTRKHTLGITPLRVDGHNGPLTRKHIRQCKYLLGYAGKRDARVSRRLMRQLAHPNWLIFSNPVRVRRGNRRRANERSHWKAEQARHASRVGTATFDGKTVAAYFVPILKWCREHGWKGTVVSGYRTPQYSEHLCYVMCGAPRCPGRCAGRSTNHAGLDPNKTPSGAVDVSDYLNFGRIVARCPLTPKLHNYLPNDRVHFSPRGN